MGEWETVKAENLVRHRSGNYYLRAKVGGKIVRRSLKTDRLKVAKIKRDAMLAELRSAAVAEPSQVRTLGDALNLVASRIAATPGHKPRTRAFYRELVEAVRGSLPAKLPAGAWTKDAAARWWATFSGARSPEQANKGLSLVRKLAAVVIEAGIRYDDPTQGLKRLRVPQSAVDALPGREEFAAVVESIRTQGKRRSREAADFVEFLALTGLRVGEARGVRWEDVGKDWLFVRDGKTGPRRVPVSGRLRELLDGMRPPDPEGPVLLLRSPRAALANACERLELPHMRIHDLRHYFATTAIEAGVDIPTVAKWLGHKDKGALAMRVYGHVRDDHSLEQVRKLP